MAEIGDDTELHIFAHSSGNNLAEIQDVGGKNAAAFAQWLANSGRAFAANDNNYTKKRSYHVYIHACASSTFARDVKDTLKQINELNDSITVYGTQGISATSVDGEAVVIPMNLTGDWEKFEAKLGLGKAREEEIQNWKKNSLVFPKGYDSY